jgi:hypothetical protein
VRVIASGRIAPSHRIVAKPTSGGDAVR